MRAILPTLLVLLAWTSPALAQKPEVGIDLGLAVPAGSLAEGRDSGPSALASLGLGTRRLGFGLRAELGWTRLRASEAASRRSDELTVRTARASLVYTLDGAAPYLLLGAGAYDLDLPEDPRETAAGLHGGAGVRFGVGRVRLVGELQGVLVLSSYAADLLEPMVYLPLTLGVRF